MFPAKHGLLGLVLILGLSGLTACNKTPEAKASPAFLQGEAALKKGDGATAMKLWQPLAEKGDARAQVALSQLYYDGTHVPRDVKLSIRWLQKAVDQNYAPAQYAMAWSYGNGEGVPQDFNMAASLYEKAAAQGNADAMNNRGLMFERGEGSAQDFKAAIAWYRKAAAKGHVWAEHNLGNFYMKGFGVAQDYAEAATWLGKSAVQGNASAQGKLGWMYDKGHGFKQNLVMAYALYHLSATTNPADAEIVKYRDSAAADMSPADLAAGQALTQDMVKPGRLEKILAKNPASRNAVVKVAPAPAVVTGDKAIFGLAVGANRPANIPVCDEKDLFSDKPLMPANTPYCYSELGTGMLVLTGELVGLNGQDYASLGIMPNSIVVNDQMYDTSITDGVMIYFDRQTVIQKIEIMTFLASDDAILQMLTGKFGKPSRVEYTAWTNTQTGAVMEKTPNYFWDLPNLYVDYFSRKASELTNTKTPMGQVNLYLPGYQKMVDDYLRKRDAPPPNRKPM